MSKLPWYTHPPADSKSTTTTFLTRESDESVLNALSTKKEMRASSRGLVRLATGSVDSREIKFDAPAPPAPSKQTKKALLEEDAMDVDEDEDDEDMDEDDDEGIESSEEEESEEEAPPPPPLSKRKTRTNSTSEPTTSKRSKVAIPAKKVTFSTNPKPATSSTTRPETRAKLKSSLKEKPVTDAKAKAEKVEKKVVKTKEVKVANSGAANPKASADGLASEAYDFKQFF